MVRVTDEKAREAQKNALQAAYSPTDGLIYSLACDLLAERARSAVLEKVRAAADDVYGAHMSYRAGDAGARQGALDSLEAALDDAQRLLGEGAWERAVAGKDGGGRREGSGVQEENSDVGFDEVLAGRYFDEEIEPVVTSPDIPPDGVAVMRRQYVEGAVANPEAMTEIRDHFNGA